MADLAAIQAEMKRRGMSVPPVKPNLDAVQAEMKRRGMAISPPAPGKNGTQPIVAPPGTVQPGSIATMFGGAKAGDAGAPMSEEEKLTLAAAGDPAMKAELAKQGLPANMDWNSGVALPDMRDFLSADNDKERTKVLEAGKKAGKWNSYGQAMGVWYVTKGQQPVAIMGLDPMKAFAASVAAHPIQSALMAGSTLIPGGRAAGAVSSGAEVTIGYAIKRFGTGAVFNLGRAAMVAGASTLGYAGDEAVKWFRGLWDKSSDEEKHQLGVAALTGFLPELFFRTGGSVVRTVGSGYAPFLTKEQRAQTMDALKRGMVPRISQATHGAAKFLPFEQSMSEYIFGFPAEERNSAAVQQIILQQAKKAGMTDAEAQASLQHIMASTTQRIDSTAVNDQMRAGAAQRIGAQQAGVEGQRQMLQTTLDNQLKNIEASIGSADPRIQDQARKALIDWRVKFGESMRPEYAKAKQIAESTGDPFVRPTADVKSMADELWKELPKNEKGEVILNDQRLIGTLVKIRSLPAYYDVMQLHELRSELMMNGKYADLQGSVAQKRFNDLAKSVTTAMEDSTMAGSNPQVAAALKSADAKWAEGMRKADGAVVDQIMKEAERSRINDPTKVADWIFNKQYTGEAQRIKGMVPPAVWNGVSAAYWQKLKEGSVDALTGALDPKKFLRTVNDQKKLLVIAFGKDKAKQIIQFANRNAVLNGKLDAKALDAGNFFTALTKYEGDKAALDTRLKSDFVNMLTGPQSERINAIDYMLEDPKRILEAKKFYGEGSNEWQQVKNTVMTRLFSSAVTPDKSLMGVVFRPGGLSGILSKYSERELTEIFGAEHAADLKQLAKTIDFMNAKPVGKMTGVFAAAHIVLHPLGHLPAIAQLYLQGQLFAQPWFVKWLTQGFEQGTMRNLDRAATLAKATAYAMLPGLTKMGPDIGINKTRQMTQPTESMAQQ